MTTCARAVALALFAATSLAGQEPHAPPGQNPTPRVQDPPAPQQQPQQPAQPASRESAPVKQAPQAAPAADSGLEVSIDFALGAGRFDHDTEGSGTLSDRTSAGYFRLGFELMTASDWGGGLRIEGTGSDDDLFVSSGAPAQEATDASLFLHFTGRFGSDAVDVPLRVGLFVRNYTIEEDLTGAEIQWSGFGPGLEVEPDLALIRGDTARLSLRGRLGLAVGVASIETEPATEDFDSVMASFDAGLGLHLAFEHVDLGIGYLFRSLDVAESDDVAGLVIREIDSEFRGLVASLAVRF
jgi:hypothetical protein